MQGVAVLRDGSIFKGEIDRNTPGRGILIQETTVFEVSFEGKPYIFEDPKILFRHPRRLKVSFVCWLTQIWRLRVSFVVG